MTRTSIIAVFMSLFGVQGAINAQGPSLQIRLAPKDRVLILAPHPDDDILGCAGVIQAAVAMKIPLQVVYLTNGDNYEWAFLLYERHPVLRPAEMRKMGEIRHLEATKAEALLGVPADHLAFLGYPDWGTEHIFMDHWGPKRPAFRSMLTKVTAVPYPDAYHPSAPYKGESVLADLERILIDFRPTKVFVTHPAEAHRDHRTAYLFMQVALWDLQDKVHAELYSYLIHFPHWPRPLGLVSGRRLEPPIHLSQLPWIDYELTAQQTREKEAALKMHQTQMIKDHAYLNAFVAANELFSRYPDIDLGARIQSSAAPMPLKTMTTQADELESADISWEHLYQEGNSLNFRMEISSHSQFDFPVNVYAFGYRHDRPFAEMPKLRLLVRGRHLRVFDQGVLLAESGATLEREDRTLLVRLPLRTLGDPERLLGTAWSRSAEEPFDWRVWRVIDLRSMTTKKKVVQ